MQILIHAAKKYTFFCFLKTQYFLFRLYPYLKHLIDVTKLYLPVIKNLYYIKWTFRNIFVLRLRFSSYLIREPEFIFREL
jgi:hypothetical protein